MASEKYKDKGYIGAHRERPVSSDYGVSRVNPEDGISKPYASADQIIVAGQVVQLTGPTPAAVNPHKPALDTPRNRIYGHSGVSRDIHKTTY